MDYGTLRVTTPDGQVREYPLDTASVVVGRADSNRVVIDHVSVSRRHARLILDGAQVLVEDLGSATGTFVGGERLAAESPRPIRAGEALRFGDAQAVFTVAGGEPAPASPDVVASQPSGGRSSVPTDQAVAISLVSPSAPVEAGATTTATCIIENRGAEADRLVIEVQNLPEGWSRITRPTIELPPGGRDEVTILLQPPRSPEARAGEHALAVAATSQLRGIEVRALGRLTILPFGGHSIELTPVRSRGTFDLKVANEGNSSISLALTAGDAAGALAIRVTPSSMDLEPGEQRSAKIDARTERRRFFGEEQIFPFEVDAQDSRAKSAATGELRSRPAWLIIRWFVAAAALALVVVGAFVAYQAFSGDDDGPAPSATPAATEKPPATANPNSNPPSPTASPTTSATFTATATRTTPAQPTNLPSVTPPSVQSRLGSGLKVQVITATNLTADPSGGARVIQTLKVGDRLIVATNTPASSTFVITEGLIFWRVVIEGTQTVGWVPEVTTAGDRRFLDLVR